VDEEMELTEDQ